MVLVQFSNKMNKKKNKEVELKQFIVYSAKFGNITP